MLGIGLSIPLATVLAPGNPAAWASSAAPAGYRWDFVTQNGALVTRSGEPVVALVRTA